MDSARGGARGARPLGRKGLTGLIDTRTASLADLPALIAHVQAGFDSYPEFAPSGWQPRAAEQDRDWMAGLLADPATWALLALAEGGSIGHVAFFPARERQPDDTRHWSERPEIPGLAHFWQLFVLPDWWGRGVAPILHDAAVAEVTARGFAKARLYTPSLHARARRFYERRGWLAQDEHYNEELQLMLTEYGLDLREREVHAIASQMDKWARREPAIEAMAIVGSWARGTAGACSDLDVVVLTDEPDAFTASTSWLEVLGYPPIVRSRQFGAIAERRVRLVSGLEIEFGIASTRWAATEPIDAGTARVVGEGFRIIHDPRGLLARLQAKVGAGE